MFNDFDIEEDCPHEYIEKSHCVNCGLTIDVEKIATDDISYSKSNLRKVSIQPKGFDKDLIDLPFDDSCKTWIQKQLSCIPQSVYKFGNRNKIIYSYVYLYHLTNSLHFDPETLATILNLDTKSVNEAMKITSGISPHRKLNTFTHNIKASIVVITPENSMINLAKTLNIEGEQLIELKEICILVIKLDEFLLDHDPKLVAAGILRYYYERKSIVFRPLGKSIGLSQAKTKKYAIIIENLLSKK
jgi:hypothetical protein